ncbi:hypothetical protein [Tenacibaculum sp. 190524A02b]|uniref:hypothetical protein n=1 Tax=Tenacibaculum vairaonense TaxID=3137860 RepID=UPI0031FB6711
MQPNNIKVIHKPVYSVEYKRQPYLSKQCGQTCLSMITGKSIDQICKEIGKEYTTNIYTDLQEFLNKNNYKAVVSYGDFNLEEIPNESIIRFKKPCGGGHYVLKVDDVFLDPLVGEVKCYMNGYKVSHYLSYKELNTSV